MARSGRIAECIIISHSTYDYVLRVWACRGLYVLVRVFNDCSRMFGGTPSWPHEITSYHVNCISGN